MNTCILIPSYEKYRVLAGFTASQIDRCWRDHPPIFFCGLSAPVRAGDTTLSLRRDGADWIGILSDAVHDIREEGFGSVYLILDDHPPLGVCRYDILNTVLPQILLNKNAENICLFGSGQGRDVEGKVTRQYRFGVEQLPDSYSWRYSLHPGLWSLQALNDLLLKLSFEITTIDDCTPWAFERISGALSAQSNRGQLTQCYRLAEPVMSASLGDKIIGVLYRVLARSSRTFAGIVGGASAWERTSERFDFIHHYFDGPYPMIWQGVMAKGHFNPEFPRFCRYFLKKRLLAAVMDLFSNETCTLLKRK